MLKSVKLSVLADELGAELVGDPTRLVSGVASLQDATGSDVSFLHNRKFLSQLKDTSAGAVIIERGLKDSSFAKGLNLLLTDEPNIAFSKAVEFFSPPPIEYPPLVHEAAWVSESADVSPDAHIGPCCVVESGARIGSRTVLVGCVYIGRDVIVGSDCLIYPSSVIRERCRLGDRVVLQPGAIIGSDGFGFETVGGVHEKVPQHGIVEIEDDVEIGACTCVDRARFAVTIVGRGTKLDNLVQIAHNVSLGEHCLFAAQVGISGSATVGDYVMFGGQAGTNPHVNIGGRTIVYARSGITKDVPPQSAVSGFPHMPHGEEMRRLVHIRKLPKLIVELAELKERMKGLEKEVEDLRKQD